MIQKLLLVRTANSKSDLLDSAKVKSFAGEPIPVSPLSWNDEAGLSHWGFELKDMKLKDFQALEKWAETADGVTVLSHEDGSNVAATLAGVGLRINKSAEE